MQPAACLAAAERVLPPPHPDLPRCSATLDREPVRSSNESGQLLLSPPSVETTLDPGATARGCVVVENRTEDTLRLRLSTVDVVPPVTPDVGPTFGGETPWGAGSWITPATTATSIGPNELVSIPFTVRVPAEAEPGSHDGALVISALPSGSDAVSIQTGLVSQVGIVVQGEVVRDGRLDVQDGPRLLRGGDTGRWQVTWTNSGTVTDHVEAELVVRNAITGKVVARRRFAEARVLRASGREVRLAWHDTPWIGRYNVSMRVRTDGGTETVRFPAVWAIPPTWFLVLAAASILLPLLGWLLRRRRRLHDAYIEELVELELEARLDADVRAPRSDR